MSCYSPNIALMDGGCEGMSSSPRMVSPLSEAAPLMAILSLSSRFFSKRSTAGTGKTKNEGNTKRTDEERTLYVSSCQCTTLHSTSVFRVVHFTFALLKLRIESLLVDDGTHEPLVTLDALAEREDNPISIYPRRER